MRSLYAVLWLAGFLAVTGLALMFLYFPEYTQPAPVYPASAGITPGSVFRGLHFWGSGLIVLIAVVHLVRTVFVKTNRRQTGWAVATLILIDLSWFTGMILPWDQLADWVHRFGGAAATTNAQTILLAVYWIHALALSVLILPVLLIYTRRMRRDSALN